MQQLQNVPGRLTLFLILGVLCWSGCPAETSENLQEECNESALISQCPPGSSPLQGSAADAACGGAVGVDLTDGEGNVSGRCLGSALCVVACQFAEPCPCGITAVTRDGVFCTPCDQTAACGNTLCEGGEDPESCPEDCGRQCAAGSERCAGEGQEVCDARGRWEAIACPSGEVCQQVRENQVTCRRDDVLVGVDPGEDPNINPEQAERFVPYVAPRPEPGDNAQPYDGRALVWVGGFTTETTAPGQTLALAPDGDSVWIWGTGTRSARYDFTGEVLESLEFPDTTQGINARALEVSADGAVALALELDSELLPDRQLFSLEGTELTSLGDTGAYSLVVLSGQVAAVSADGSTGAALIHNAYTYVSDPRFPNERRLVTVEYAIWLSSFDDTPPRVIYGGPDGAMDLSLSPNGRIATVIRLSNPIQGTTQIELFDTQTNERLASILTPDGGGQFVSAHHSPRGDKLAIRNQNSIEIWDITIGALIAQIPQRNQLVAWSPDGTTLLVGTERYTEDGAGIEPLPAPETERVGAIAGMRFGPGGRLLVWRSGAMLEVDIYEPAP